MRENKNEFFAGKLGEPSRVEGGGVLGNVAIAVGDLAIQSKGSVSQLMDDLDLINSVEKVEAMVNSIQKGVENVLRK